MKKLSLFAAFAAATLGLTTASSAKVVGPWEIAASEGYCNMFAEFESGTAFGFSWFPDREETRVLVMNDNWDHLRERDGEMVRMELDIVGEGVEFDKWWNDQTLIIALDTGTEVFITHWDREHAQEFQAAMSAGEAVAVEADGVQIGQFSLSGAREAMIELKRCGADVLRGVKYN